MHKRSIAIALLLFFITGGNFASAASLYLDPESTTFSTKDTFTVKIRLNNESECVNAAQVIMSYPREKVKAIDTSRADSIFTLWPEEPEINNEAGEITFAGGIPGGYCGRVPGDPGLTNNLLTVIFQPHTSITDEEESVALSITEDSSVYLHDGRGTKANLTTFGAELRVDKNKVEGTGQWFEMVRQDTTPPQPFTIEVVKNPGVFGGKYYIVFSAVDKESGIDHYEVYEKELDDDFLARLLWFDRAKEFWQNIASPYVIKDQSLNSIIMVKAIDKAGNERIVSYTPPEYLREPSNIENYLLIAAGVLLLILAGLGLKFRPQIMKAFKNNPNE